MINVNTNYKDILDHFNFVSSIEANKKELIDIAKRGEKRPSAQTCLGIAFYNYTRKKSNSYDDMFTKTLKTIRPDWFLSPTEIKKNNFIEMAKKGLEKPKFTTHEGQNLQYYLKNDMKFRSAIKNIAPKWIVPTGIERRKINEIKIEKLARSKVPLPSIKTKIGRLISRYKRTNKKFMEKIKKINPQWFATQTDKVNEKKKKVLELIKIKNSKPPKYLYLFTHKHSWSFDPKLNRIVRKNKPEWFLSPKILVANENKRKLIEMAKKGAKRPNQKTTKLGSALTTYTCKTNSSYDKNFDIEIRRIAPHWFAPNYLSLKNLRIDVIKNKIKSVAEYKQKRKREWPSNPNSYYKEWTNWYYLGIGT